MICNYSITTCNGLTCLLIIGSCLSLTLYYMGASQCDQSCQAVSAWENTFDQYSLIITTESHPPINLDLSTKIFSVEPGTCLIQASVLAVLD